MLFQTLSWRWYKMGRIQAIVLAAGRGSRMLSDIPKQFMEIDGRPVVWYSLDAMEKSCVGDVVIVTAPEYIGFVKHDIVERYRLSKVRAVVSGGAQRYDSVWEGLKALRDMAGTESRRIVLIHDGARPMVTPELIARLAAGADMYRACIPGVKLKDTVRFIEEEDMCGATPQRARLRAVQTPQAFEFELCLRAYEMLETGDVSREDVTDDAMVVEAMCGVRARFIEGDERNIKITTPEDMMTARSLLISRSKGKN